MSLLKRSVSTTAASAPPLSSSLVECLINLPCLYEFLTLQLWEPGSPRKPGTVSIFWEDGVWKCWLNDKDASRSACASAPCLQSLLLKVDQKLMEDSLEWRKARPEVGRAGRK